MRPNMTSCKENTVQGIPPRRGNMSPSKYRLVGDHGSQLNMIRVLSSILEFLSLRTLVPYPCVVPVGFDPRSKLCPKGEGKT